MLFSDAYANKTLDAILGASRDPEMPATVYVALGRGATDVNGTGFVEAVGTGYARAAVPNDGTGWAAAAARAKGNAVEVKIGPVGAGGWGGTCTQFVLFDAAAAGQIIGIGTIDGTGFADTVDVTAVFSAGALVVEFPAA